VLAGRSPGHSLDETGRAEAARLATDFAGRTLAAIVSSPLERARETAAAIAEGAGLPVEIDPALTEIDFGDWTGSRFDALHGSEAWRCYNAFRGTACIPGGEAMLDVQARAVAAMVRARDAHHGAEVVLVSHADVIKAVLAHFLGAPLDLFQRIAIAPASRSVVRLGPDWVRIEAVNLPPGR
jgi:probable phosphoglycerate mutase